MNKKTTLSTTIKKYFLDFFMLFLAVFMGFYAENLRDQSSERAKEKEYINSMIKDVKTDKGSIAIAIRNNNIRKVYLDSLSDLIFGYNAKSKNDFQLYKYYPIVMMRPDFFHPTELTMQQLKNAGGMRLIRSKKAVDAILLYDLKDKKLKNQQKYYENYHNNSINLGLKIFNHHKIKKGDSLTKITKDIRLLNKDKMLLNEFGNTIIMYRGIVNYYKMLLTDMDKQVDTLVVGLSKEYKLKNFNK